MIKIDVNVIVNLDQLADDVEKAAQKGLQDLGMAAFSYWQNIAGDGRLHSTQRDYQDAIQYRKTDDNTFQMYLRHPDKNMNKLVNMLEGGAPPYTTHLHATLKGHKSMYWTGGKSKSRFGFKWRTLVERGKTGLNKPFMDIPIYGKGVARQAAKPSHYRRLTEGNIEAFKHKGFKPKGDGGLHHPMRDDVVEYIKEQASIMFSAALGRTKA